jgi:hypothetical protein
MVCMSGYARAFPLAAPSVKEHRRALFPGHRWSRRDIEDRRSGWADPSAMQLEAWQLADRCEAASREKIAKLNRLVAAPSIVVASPVAPWRGLTVSPFRRRDGQAQAPPQLCEQVRESLTDAPNAPGAGGRANPQHLGPFAATACANSLER